MNGLSIATITTALVNGGILGLVISAAVWLLLRVIPRRALNAATRYAIWWATLGLVIAMPLFYLPARAPREEAPRRTFESMTVSSDTTPAVVEAVPLVTTAPVESTYTYSESGPLFPIQIAASKWFAGIAIAWLLVSLAMLVRLGAAVVVLKRRKARAFAAPAEIAARLEQWVALCGTRRHIALASSSEISTPMAAGLSAPAILIPAQLFAELNADEIDQIGVHEAAHLSRRDDYALILQRVIEALFALHPVVRWIARRIDLEREIACDDFVIEATGRARPYAQCLTRVVELAGGVRGSLIAAAATEEPSHLAQRVEMLLDKKRHTGTRLLKVRLVAALGIVVGLVALLATVPGVVAFAAPTDTEQDYPWQPPTPPAPPAPLVAPLPPAPVAAPGIPEPTPAPDAPLPPAAPVALELTQPPDAPPAPAAPQPPTPRVAPAPADYVIRVGDFLRIEIWRDPSDGVPSKVREDGKIVRPLIGEVMAAGSTPAEFASKLRDAYRGKLVDPRIRVTVVDANNDAQIAPSPAVWSPTPAARPAFAPVAYAPQTPPSPQSPPAPPAPREGSTSYSVHSHNGEVDVDWHWRDGLNSRDVRMHGTIEFTDDESDVKSISSGGWFSFEESHALSGRKFQATADGSGGIKRQFFVDGREHPFDNDAKVWLRANLPEMLRESAVNAPERVRRLLKIGGPNAVLAEIGKIHSNGARRRYIEELLPLATLTTDQLQTLLRDTRAIGSDGDKASLLITLSRYTLKDNLRDYLFDAISTIGSSGDRRRVLLALIQQDPSRATLAAAAKSAEHISSDGDKAAVLVEMAHSYRGNEEMRRAFFRAADSIGSSGDRARVIIAVIDGGGTDRDSISDALNSAKGIGSDGDKARVLVQASSHFVDDVAVRRAFFDAAASIGSSGERARVLIALANRGGLGNAAWIDLIHCADSIGSDGDKTRVLTTAIERGSSSNEALIAAVQSAARIGSEGEKSRVLILAIDRSSGKPAVRTEIRNAVRTLHSDGEFRRVMSLLDRQAAL